MGAGGGAASPGAMIGMPGIAGMGAMGGYIIAAMQLIPMTKANIEEFESKMSEDHKKCISFLEKKGFSFEMEANDKMITIQRIHNGIRNEYKEPQLSRRINIVSECCNYLLNKTKAKQSTQQPYVLFIFV